LERIVKEIKIWIQKGQRCIIKEVHNIFIIMGLLCYAQNRLGMSSQDNSW